MLFQIQATSGTKPSTLSTQEKTYYVLIPTDASKGILFNTFLQFNDDGRTHDGNYGRENDYEYER